MGKDVGHRNVCKHQVKRAKSEEAVNGKVCSYYVFYPFLGFLEV